MYLPGNSWLHRRSAGAKFAALIVLLVVSSVAVQMLRAQDKLFVAVPWLAITLLGYAVCRVPWFAAKSQLLPPLPLLIVFGALLWWRNGWAIALSNTCNVYAAVAAASLVLLTTSMGELLETVEKALRPFARFGLPVEQIILAFCLTIRLIPQTYLAAVQVREAMQARGVTGFFSLARALGVPLLIRCLMQARSMGEALSSRGYGDE